MADEFPRISRISLLTGCNVEQNWRMLRSGGKIRATTGRQARTLRRNALRSAAEPVEMCATGKCLGLGIEGGPELFPGIPNEITLNLIIPKLSWRDLPVLSCVSQHWRHAIDSRQVYNARVRHHSTETLLLINSVDMQDRKQINSLGLYSTKGNSFFELPPIQPMRHLQEWCGVVALDGRVYVMGGRLDDNCETTTDKVYVYDMVGKRQWQQCTSMIERRYNFGCGVFNGMIYVFGGWNSGFECGSEMFDPAQNVWHSIMPKSPSRHCFNRHVGVIGGELLVHGPALHDGDNLLIYHPGRNDWRALEHHRLSGLHMLFVAHGKLYAMSHSEIHVHYLDDKPWKLLHTFSFPAEWPIGGMFQYRSGWSIEVSILDGELVALVYCLNRLRIFQSGGFGAENKEIFWKVKGDLPFWVIYDGPYVLHPIQV